MKKPLGNSKRGSDQERAPLDSGLDRQQVCPAYGRLLPCPGQMPPVGKHRDDALTQLETRR